jgi:hypothetical protein
MALMGLQDVAALADIVNAGAVTATLVFLIISIRQNTQAQRVLAVESLTAAITAINVPAMESTALGEALLNATRDWSSASRDQRIIAHYFMFSLFKLLETAWYQQKNGTLEPEQWAGWEDMLRRQYHSPGIRNGWWPYRRASFSPAFQAYLANTQPPAEGLSLQNIFDEPAQQE